MVDETPREGFHPGFETQRRCYFKSKTGVFVAPCPPLLMSNKKGKSPKIGAVQERPCINITRYTDHGSSVPDLLSIIPA